jgi:DNA-binding response OmpR family regulator
MVQSSSSQYPRALIVEDETMVALGLEAHLRELGFQACDLAADGHQALSRAMSNQPNVVLMGVNLEGNREGIEVARSLRETCDVPIILSPDAPTAKPSNCFAQRCRRTSSAKASVGRSAY